MALSVRASNRIGFALLGLTNNFAYVVMLAAAYDLLKQSDSSSKVPVEPLTVVPSSENSTLQAPNNGTTQKYCNEHSTSTILLADTLPSLFTKVIYPFFLVGFPNGYKAGVTALLAAAAFVITGLSASQYLIFTGVICASLSSGLGETTYLSNTPLYGDVSLSGWSIGTGAAGLLGSAAYALLRIIFPIKVIMILMLVVPIVMVWSYFFIIKPLDSNCQQDSESVLHVRSTQEISSERRMSGSPNYGSQDAMQNNSPSEQLDTSENFDLRAKIRSLPSLAKYFLPLLLVYFAEYFINQGLFELIYFPNISFASYELDHASQYSWFQVSYQLGVLISRSSLDFFTIKNIWAMSILQALNAILFLLHTSKQIHIPSFYLVVSIIIYEGLLGGFTYVNAFFRVKNEVTPSKQEFSLSAVTMADSLGIVAAGFVAMPVHDALCKLYV